MLTWTNGVVFQFDLDLNLLKTFPLPSEIKEGWGMTHDDQYIYISNGSPTIFIIDPQDFTIVGNITVSDINGSPLYKINEIEMVNNTYIYANKWMTNNIYKIDA